MNGESVRNIDHLLDEYNLLMAKFSDTNEDKYMQQAKKVLAEMKKSLSFTLKEA